MEKPLTYNKICIQTRKKLVQMVQQQKISIAKASRILGIKNSTGKLIVKRYRQTGTFFQPKHQSNLQNFVQNSCGHTSLQHPQIKQHTSLQHPQIKQNSQGQQVQEVVKEEKGETPIFYFYQSAIDINFNLWLYRWGQSAPNSMEIFYWG